MTYFPFLVLLLHIYEGEALHPSHQIYPAVVHTEKLGVGIDPIKRHQFIIDQDFSHILLPRSYLASNELEMDKACTALAGQKEYLDLGGPKLFLIGGCSPWVDKGLLGLGPHSPLWAVFEGYSNRGGRVQMLSDSMQTDGILPKRKLSEAAPLLNTSYIWNARTGKLMQQTSYTLRGGMGGDIATLAGFFLYAYLRSKVVRKLVYPWKESELSRTFRGFFSLFLVIAIPVLVEFYGARVLLTEDIGLARSILINLYVYWSTLLVLVHLVGRFFLKRGDSGWATRMALLDIVSSSTTSLMGAWYCLLWWRAADSGSFMSCAILVFVFYEQTVLLILNIARSAGGHSGDPIWWSTLWWMMVMLPLWTGGLWITSTLSVWPFVEDRIMVNLLAIRAVSYTVMMFVLWIAATHVRDGMHTLSKVVLDKAD